jgi:hypothetical protein
MHLFHLLSIIFFMTYALVSFLTTRGAEQQRTPLEKATLVADFFVIGGSLLFAIIGKMVNQGVDLGALNQLKAINTDVQFALLIIAVGFSSCDFLFLVIGCPKQINIYGLRYQPFSQYRYFRQGPVYD